MSAGDFVSRAPVPGHRTTEHRPWEGVPIPANKLRWTRRAKSLHVPGVSPARYIATLRGLKPEQIAYRLLRPFWRWRASGSVTPQLAIAAPPRHLPTCHQELCGSAADISSGDFRFWGKSERLSLERPWCSDRFGQSWSYPVHYFDFGPPLAAARGPAGTGDREAAMELVAKWIAAHPAGTPVAWDPYPTAIRIVNWVEMLHLLAAEAPDTWRHAVLQSLHQQAEWLARRLERHLLGAHLLKDLKALLIASTLFADSASIRWRREGERLLRRELKAQFRHDGSHLEPSFMYHCMTTADLLDLLNFGAVSTELAQLVAAIATSAVAYAVGVATPSGDYPLFGDAWRGGAATPVALADYAARLGLGPAPRETAGMQVFRGAEVVVWRDARSYLVADLGNVGPSHLAGHGHNDSLSFEWYVDGMALLVDSGTFSYENDPPRATCRLTPAHNTLQVDAHEQHELWAAFRVGRRSRVWIDEVGENLVSAQLEPWHDARIRVQRRFAFTDDAVRIHDSVRGRGEREVTSRLHLHPECSARLVGETLRIARGSVTAAVRLVDLPGAARLLGPESSGSMYAEHAGEMRRNAVLVLESRAPLPWNMSMELRVADFE